MEAAADIFGEVGFDASTTREIAERAAVNKALIHYHFGSKDGLLERLLDRYYDELSETLTTRLAGSDGDLRAALATVIDAYLDFLAANRSFQKIVLREVSGGRHMAKIRDRTVPLFELGIRAVNASFPGSVGTPLAAPHLLTSFYGMIISTFTYSSVLEELLGIDPLSPAHLEQRKQHLRTMLDITLAALEEQE